MALESNLRKVDGIISREDLVGKHIPINFKCERRPWLRPKGCMHLSDYQRPNKKILKRKKRNKRGRGRRELEDKTGGKQLKNIKNK